MFCDNVGIMFVITVVSTIVINYSVNAQDNHIYYYYTAPLIVKRTNHGKLSTSAIIFYTKITQASNLRLDI